MTESEGQDSGGDSRPFMCGVVEGFYGRPWTLTQRKDLFEKMESWGMCSYLYAPKDDCKHRAFWRELYTVEEAEHLQSLILAAQESNVNFFYAISPGLDIVYSNSKEIGALKRKLDQVAQLGCKSFALLFDDIEAEMQKPDKEAFQSFAHAQVSVTNEIYQHLGQPSFLFCPTQYCTSRAVPTIATSEYLKTIGMKLASNIDIMWTGDKVIPKEITVASLEPITQALKRKVVIWDNEHANDYDQRRVFLGPYSGRSPDIIQKLRGVLTNPNCEYGANFVAIHSLAAWSKCTVDGCSSLSANDTVSSDIKLELGNGTNGDSEDVVPPPPDKLPPHVYHPRIALKSAIRDWLPEFNRVKSVWGPISKPQVGLNPTGILQPIINTCINSTSTTSSLNLPIPAAVLVGTPADLPNPKSSNPAEDSSTDLSGLLSLGSVLRIPVMNSLVSTHEVVMLTNDPKSMQPEPMETNIDAEGSDPAAGSSPGSKVTDVIMESTTNPPTPAGMQVEPTDGGGGLSKAESTTMLCEPTSPEKEEYSSIEDLDSLSYDDLQLFCDLFYLPCEHGPTAVEILTEFYWLKTHAGVMLISGSEDGEPEDAKPEWESRRARFNTLLGSIKRAFDRLCVAPNRELVYNLYTYIWDLVGVLLLLESYIDWLALGFFSPKYKQLVIGRHTWFSGIREAFLSGDHEPYVFRGGLTADLQRLMPVDSGNDLFMYQYPDHPTNIVYKIRPFKPQDEEACYRIALQTWEDGMDATQFYSTHPRLVGEKSIGPFISFYSNFGFVFENSVGEIVGYIFAATDIKEFYQRVNIAWLPEMRTKYPKVEWSEGELPTPCETTINSFHESDPVVPPGLDTPEAWALVRIAYLPSISDLSLASRATMLVLACLRTSGVLKALAEVPKREKYVQEVYSKIGFAALTETGTGGQPSNDISEDYVYMSRRY